MQTDLAREDSVETFLLRHWNSLEFGTDFRSMQLTELSEKTSHCHDNCER